MKTSIHSKQTTTNGFCLPAIVIAGFSLLATSVPAGAVPAEKAKAVSVRLETSSAGPTPRMVPPPSGLMPPISSAGMSTLRSLATAKPRQRQGAKPFVVDRPHPKDGGQARGSRNWSECFFWYCTTYTLARVANSTVNSQATTLLQPVAGMPYAATGRLHVATTNTGVFDRICTAALIGRGIIVTAANCVSKAGAGSQGLAKAVRFIPANTGSTLSSGPYGAWAGTAITVPSVYANGTDTCIDPVNKRGCVNDLAVILLAKNASGLYPSGIPQVSYYRYGEAGYGCANGQWFSYCQMAVLAYASGFDNGNQMQRLDVEGTSRLFNSYPNRYGFASSPFRAGSEGAPGIVNLGAQPSFTGGAPGKASLNNVVIGVMSWHSFIPTELVAGATLFGINTEFNNNNDYSSDGINYGRGNIGYLVNEVCRSDGPAQLRGKPKGACLTAN